MSSETAKRMALAAVCLAAAALLFGGAARAEGLKVGDMFPSMPAGAGAPEVKGKVVLVDFWASWCAPCKRSFPELQALDEKYRARGLTVLAINEDDDPEAMRRFLKDRPVSFSVFFDKDHELVQKTGVDAMPTSILVGRDGRVLHIQVGFQGDKTVQALTAQIEKALAVGAGDNK
jgi:thiol-disulfide isomerase/thioredoxin